MKNIFLFILICFSTAINSACSNQTQKEINESVDSFYKSYKGNFREADSRYLSEDLAATIRKVIDFEKKSTAFTKNSNHPTDKPQLMEGDLFVSLYEGYTNFNIKEIKQYDNKASVIIEFVNSNYQISWTDEVVLIKENNWKIDDVNYLLPSKKNLSLKLLMEQFIKLPLN